MSSRLFGVLAAVLVLLLTTAPQTVVAAAPAVSSSPRTVQVSPSPLPSQSSRPTPHPSNPSQPAPLTPTSSGGKLQPLSPALSGPSGSYAQTVLSDSPRGYWRLDETSGTTAVDSSPNAVNGTYGGNFILGQPGALVGDPGTSMASNGSGYVALPSSPSFPSEPAAPFSIETWVKLTTTGTGYLFQGSHQFSYSLQLDAAEHVVLVTSNGCCNTSTTTSNATLGLSVWHHVVAVVEGSVNRIYIDGVQDTYSRYGWGGYCCGNYGTPYFGSVPGLVDEVALYPSALSQARITAHLQAAGYTPPAPTGVTAAAGAGQATISWTASGSGGGGAVSGYLISALKGGVKQSSTNVGPAATSVTMTGLAGNANYTFTVAAENGWGIGAPSAASTAVTTSSAAYQYASTVLGDGPVTYYRLGDLGGGIAADSSGTDRHLTPSGSGNTQGVPGALPGDPDRAYQMAGVPLGNLHVTGLPGGATGRTFEAWIKTTANGDESLYGYGALDVNRNSGYQLRLHGSNQLALYSGLATTYVTSPVTLNDGNVHYIAVVYDGNTTLSLYVDDNAPASAQLAGAQGALNTIPDDPNGLWIGRDYYQASGYYSGLLDEVAFYPSALSAAQIHNHRLASGIFPTAPQNVTAAPGIQQATVSWAAPASSGTSPLRSYTVTPFQGTTPGSSITVDASQGSTVVPNLQGGAGYTFQVAATNATGTGYAASSPVIQTQTAGVSGFGNYLYIRSLNASAPQPHYSIASGGNLPALGQWTVEGEIWGLTSTSTTYSHAAWGILGGTAASPDGTVAGIIFQTGSVSDLHSYWVWPGGGKQGFSQETCEGLPLALSPYAVNCTVSSTPKGPTHVALTYDGATVRGFLNGVQQFATPSTSAALPAAPAGYSDHAGLRTGNWDEFRVSSIARYSAAFTPPAGPFSSDAQTSLLWHYDDYRITKLPPATICANSGAVSRSTGVFLDSSGNGNNADVSTYSDSGGIGCDTEEPFSLAPGVSSDEVAGGGNGWYCACLRSSADPVDNATGEFHLSTTDLAIAGRGHGLEFTRTYSSLRAAEESNASLSPPAPYTALGRGWTFNYATYLAINGQNVTLYGPNGASTAFKCPGTAGSCAATSHLLATLTLNADGSYSLVDKSGDALTFKPAPNSAATGQLTSWADRNGYATTLSYDANGFLTRATDASDAGSQRVLSLSYANGVLQSVSDGTRTVSFAYQGPGLASSTDVVGGVTKYGYDSAFQMTNFKDAKCSADPSLRCTGTSNTYSGGQVTQQTIYVSPTQTRTWSWSYGNPQGTVITDPDGNLSVELYMNNILLSRSLIIDPTKPANGGLYDPANELTWTFNRDSSTLAAAVVTDPNGHSLTDVRDARGNVLQHTDGDGRTTVYTYNSFSEPLTAKDPLGVTTTYVYDAKGNATSVSRPLVGTAQTQSTGYAYDPSHPGDLVSMTDPAGQVWKYAYDAYGNRVKQTDPLGHVTTYAYDVLGRQTSTTRPNENAGGTAGSDTWSKTYFLNNRVQTSTDPIGNRTQYTYDENWNPKTVVDALTHTTTFTYDYANQLTQTQAPLSTTSTAYDAAGQITDQYDGLNHDTKYAYDRTSRMVSITDALNRVTNYNYDPAGNLASTVGASGKLTGYRYDAANQRVGIYYGGGARPSVSLAYDADGRRTSMADDSGQSTYTYDSLHRLTSYSNGAQAVVSYGYSLRNEVTSLGYAGLSVSRSWDAAGRLQTITDPAGKTLGYAYDADGNMTALSYPNGTQSQWTYDRDSRVTQIKAGAVVGGTMAAPFFSAAYTRDGLEQVTSESPQSYAYDANNRLSAGGNGGSTGYAYNADDTLKTITGVGSSTALTYDVAQQLQSVTTTPAVGAATTVGYTYDPDGNRVGSGSSVYQWDQGNRLAGTGSVTYGYNGDRLRQSKTVSGTTTQYTWDAAAGLPTILSEGSKSYVTGADGLALEEITGTVVRYLYQDQLGSTRALADANGVLSASLTYDAYGNLLTSTGTDLGSFRFAGQQYDPETGFYYLRARYYDPSTGQFISRDPMAAVTRQPYPYVADNPLNRLDAQGLCWPSWSCAAENAIGGTVVGAVNWASAHPTQTAAIVVGVALIVAATVLTLGVGDALLASFAAIDIAEAAGLLETVDLAIHAPLVLAPGLALGGAGAVALEWGLTSHYDSSSNGCN